MMTITGNILYFHDFMTDDEQTSDEIRIIQREFSRHGFHVPEIQETERPPFVGASNERGYDILLFDWGGASLGNSTMSHFCHAILKEAVDMPNRTYIMTSSFTFEAMKEAKGSFERANGSVPANVFLNIEQFCKYIKS